MIIRPATIADLPGLIVLFQQEMAYQRQMSPVCDLSPDFDWKRFAEMKLNNPNERVLVAEEGGQLLGHIDVRAFLPSQSRPARNIVRRFLRPEKPPLFVWTRTVGRIEDCYVETQFRRRGIASALVKEGLAWLQHKGVKRIELAVSTANGSGRAFWEKQGFSAYRLLMSRPIE